MKSRQQEIHTGWSLEISEFHDVPSQKKSEKEYKAFVNNRVKKIRSKPNIILNHVPTKENPADIGSRGSHGDEIPDLFKHGPDWLTDESRWPDTVQVSESTESEEEAKKVREILATTVNAEPSLHQKILAKFSLRKSLRVLG